MAKILDNHNGMAGQRSELLRNYSRMACLGATYTITTVEWLDRATKVSRIMRFWRLLDRICGKVLNIVVLALLEENYGYYVAHNKT